MAEPAFLLDSNSCIYLLKDLSPPLSARVAGQAAGSLFMSSISLAEVSLGFGTQAASSPALAALVMHVPVLPFDEAAARAYALLPFRRGSFDRLIAAQAISRDIVLVTNNEAGFEAMPGLIIENWTLPQ